jgi:hypothetical protein
MLRRSHAGQALRGGGHEVELVSRLRVYDGVGDPAVQKAIAEAEQQAAAAEAAEVRRKHDAHVKANRARLEKEAKRRETAIAKRKAENASKEKEAPPAIDNNLTKFNWPET